MHSIFRHFRRNIFRGLISLIPLVLTVSIVLILYNFIDRHIVTYINRVFDFGIPGLGFVILIVFLYIIGIASTNLIGRKIEFLVDKIFEKIPLVRITYQLGKQVAGSLSVSEKQTFKKAVLIEYFKKDSWVIGFVMGDIQKKGTDEKLLKVFIPTVPNPTSGFLVFTSEKDVIDPGWSIEEAMKMVLSGGLATPDQIDFKGI
jgi:uncharacterized membrane protein